MVCKLIHTIAYAVENGSSAHLAIYLSKYH